jgi:adenine deaminase
VIDLPRVNYPEWAMQSVHLQRPLTSFDFRFETRLSPTVTANVIGVIENQAPTRHLRIRMPVQDGEVCADITRDIAKVALVERHRSTGCIQLGFVQGFGLTAPCALASTVAHDSHHMLVVGTDDENMAMAANILAACGGGQVVVKDGEIAGQVELPIAGLMSNEKAENVSQKAASLLQGFRACGCNLNNANMQLRLLALVVIPELRISDLGLVDVEKFTFIPVLE